MQLIKRLPESFRNIGTLVLGNSFAALFPLLLTPILTRVYTESEFGIYTTYVAIVAIFCSFSTGRYDLAILESPTKKIAIHLAYLAGYFSILVSILALFIMALISKFIPELKNIQLLDDLIYLIPISIFSISLVQITSYCLNREKYFREMAGAKVVKSGLGSSIQILNGFYRIGLNGLVIGKLLGEIASFIFGLMIIFKKKLFKYETYSTRILAYVLKKYHKYLKINSLHSLISVSTTSSIPIILGLFYSNDVVGAYGLSFSVCFLPVTLISQAVFQIFSREVSIKIDDNRGAYNYFKSTAVKLTLVSVPIFTILALFGDSLFVFIFGNNWEQAGQFARILAPYLFTSFVVSPFTFIALKINKHEFTFKLELIGIVIKTGAITVGSYYFNEFIGIALFSFSGVLLNIYLFNWIHKKMKKM